MNFNVFVSYSTRDISQVLQLQQQLAGSPIKVFVAEHSIVPSQDLAQAINSAIEQCDLFVLLWSKNAQASDWVSQEIGKATALKKQILPLILDDGMNLPGFIHNLKHLPVHSNPSAALERAREVIIKAYEKKSSQEKANAAVKAEENKLALLGFGALLLWAFNK